MLREPKRKSDAMPIVGPKAVHYTLGDKRSSEVLCGSELDRPSKIRALSERICNACHAEACKLGARIVGW
jgi:hypothetical protein